MVVEGRVVVVVSGWWSGCEWASEVGVWEAGGVVERRWWWSGCEASMWASGGGCEWVVEWL